MLLLAISPVAVNLGPLSIRWYGILMAVSVAVGFYYLLRNGRRLAYDEDFLYNLTLLVVIAGIAGARLVYVVTNWGYFAAVPWETLRLDMGGLSFHGAVLGGVLAGLVYVRRHKASFGQLADLAVPGLALGIALVRWANILNEEVVGRVTTGGWQHPAQIYGSAIGVTLLVIHRVLARRRPPAGYLFWSFVFYYSILRGVVEETFRANPLYAGGWVFNTVGAGFFTLTHLVTPFLVALAWLMRRRAVMAAEPSAVVPAAQAGAAPSHK